MNTIQTTTPYGLNTYSYGSGTAQAASGALAPSQDQKTDTGATTEAARDRVTLSGDVSIAQTRELMGLNPTGKLLFKDMESTAAARSETVTAKISGTMSALGIDPDQEFTISVDAEYQIRIPEDFPGRDALEETLNGDEAFVVAFKQLNANQSILNYRTQLLNQNRDVAGYFNSNTNADNLLTLAARHTEIKSSTNRMATLLGLGQTHSPFTYRYPPETGAI